jgi:hypothetical protein
MQHGCTREHAVEVEEAGADRLGQAGHKT